jgi:D-tyrosyl-tRNA(Tyr) deacylase
VKAVIQRVRDASVSVDGKIKGRVESGLLVYIGVAKQDTPDDAARLAEKIAGLRIFEDAGGTMNLSLRDIRAADNRAGALVVSQFTLLADTRKGRRPYYGAAAEPEKARELYDCFLAKIRALDIPCESGVFQTRMEVSATNTGPVTIILDTEEA